MEGRSESGAWRVRPLRSMTLIAAAACAFMMYTCLLWLKAVPSCACTPGGVERKTVHLDKNHVESEQVFSRECGKCHKAPDPAKPNCAAGSSVNGFIRISSYLANVRAGKELYEENCGGCHKLIEPESHAFDFWSKNLCTSDDVCIMKKKLNAAEEQQLLLYLSAHSKKQ